MHREQLQRDHYLANIGQVATTIVHDLKNPLVTILGFARRIKEGKGKTDTAVQEIIDSAENMQKIVHDVLDFAKPLQLELKEDDIKNVIKRAYEFCKVKAEGQGVTISTNLPSKPVNVAVDSFHLERAIANLITNAIEASHKGQNIMVDVIPEKYYLAIRIKDEGSGMDKETLENIFIPFYSKKSGGTGLGMPIAKKIIEGHQGKIYVDSKPVRGTEITMRLPYS
jgi:signal transduction histidine kinase